MTSRFAAAASGLAMLAAGFLPRVEAQPALPIPDPAMEPTATPPPSLFAPVQPGAIRPIGTPTPFATPFSLPRPPAPTPTPQGIFSTTPTPAATTPATPASTPVPPTTASP
ncbi:MAG: hypothetical protein N2322_07145, partial [Terrimicrobiaceae bacterium]|nr:hypothetical protein [Terrimicrobiaceae bacterium]